MTPNLTPASDLAMQIRCVHCHREQYGPAVWDISHGKDCCPWCGEQGKVMTKEEYRAAMEDYWK